MSIELIVSVLFGFTAVYFAISYISLNQKLKALRESFIELYLANLSTQKDIEDSAAAEAMGEDATHRENFIKFLSESRDWAFAYIEEVQAGLNKFVVDVEPEINYFREHGDLSSMQPNYYSLKKITQSFDELVKLLPEEDSPKQ